MPTREIKPSFVRVTTNYALSPGTIKLCLTMQWTVINMHPSSPNRKRLIMIIKKKRKKNFFFLKQHILQTEVKHFEKLFSKTMKHQFYRKQKRTATNNRNLTRLWRNAYAFKRLQIVGLSNTKWAHVFALVGVNIYTHMQSHRTVVPAENALWPQSVVTSQCQQREHQGLRLGREWRGEVPLYQVVFSYPINQHQDFGI